jgi:ribosomal protein S18 acetylase RimI-like enzyme
VWEGPSPRPDPVEGQRWLYQVTIAPKRRGRGYGRAALERLEPRLRREGVGSLQLHVFRWNAVAISLYRSAGYSVVDEGTTDQNMVKRLGPAPSARR